jgi:hypothetical protein
VKNIMEINEKTKKYHTIITVPQSNEKNLQRGKIDTADTQKKAINKKCLSCLVVFLGFVTDFYHRCS